MFSAVMAIIFPAYNTQKAEALKHRPDLIRIRIRKILFIPRGQLTYNRGR